MYKRYVLAVVLIGFIIVGLEDWLDLSSVVGLNNAVTVINDYTSPQPNHPIWFPRYFAQGEIPEYCQPYATPSDTGIRAAVSEWQCDVKVRHRDATSARAITNVRTTNPSWTNGVSGTSASVSNFVITFNLGGGHGGLQYGDALVVTGAPTDADMKASQPYIVQRINDSDTVEAMQHNGAIFSTGGSWTVVNVIDPMNLSGMRLTSADHRFRIGDEITCSGIGGVTGANGTFRITGITRDEFVVNAAGTGSFTAPGTCSGPAEGSVAYALIALKTNLPITNGGYTRIDFVNSSNPCSSGNQAACDAAGFDKAEMLAPSWGLQADFTAPVAVGHTATYSFNARNVLTDWNEVQKPCGPRYWTRGPVLTWLILENNCMAAETASITISGTNADTPYDFGWRMGGAGSPAQTLTTNVSTSSTQVGINTLGEVEEGSRLWLNTQGTAGSANGSPTTNGAEVMLVNTIDQATTICDGQPISMGTPCLNVSRAQDNSVLGTFVIGKIFGVFQWRDGSEAFRSGRPSAQLKFIGGGGGWGVGLRIEVFNSQFEKWQSLWYSATIRTGVGLSTRLSYPAFKHTTHTSWKADTWDGADPQFYCKDAGSDPENCATILAQRSDDSLTRIEVSGSSVNGTGKATTQSPHNVTAGHYITIASGPFGTISSLTDPTCAAAGVACMNGTYEVTNVPDSTSFQWATLHTNLGIYTDSTIKIYRGTRHRRYHVDFNAPYLFYSRALPQWKLYPGLNANTYRYGFWRSDKAGVGVYRNRRTMSCWGSNIWPLAYLGLGTYGAEKPGMTGGAITYFANCNGQEGTIMEDSEVKMMEGGFGLEGYEVIFGDSNPGGGGNAAAQEHEPNQHTESGFANQPGVSGSVYTTIARPYMVGFSDVSFGKALNTYARVSTYYGGLTGSANSTVDRPKTLCSVGTLPVTWTTGTNVDRIDWPCTNTAIAAGVDGWGIETAHQNDRVWWAYMLSGDYSHLRILENQHHWQCNNAGNKNFNKPWCFFEATGGAGSRVEATTTRSIVRLAKFYPNTPQWGQSTPPVESFYYDQKLWDLALGKEGGMQIANGWWNIFYGFQGTDAASMGCTNYDAGGAPTGREDSIYRFNRCDAGHYNNRNNTLGWPTFSFGTSAGCGTYPSCAPGSACTYINCMSGITEPSQPSWMFSYGLTQWAHNEMLGKQHFYHVLRKGAALATNIAGNQLVNPYLSNTYETPAPVNADLTFRTSMEQYVSGYASTWTFVSTNTNPPVIQRDAPSTLNNCNYVIGIGDPTCGNPYQYVARAKTGLAVAADPVMMPGIFANTLNGCTPADVPPNGCTPLTAWNRLNAFNPVTGAYATEPRFAMIPREVVTNLTALPGGGAVTFSYLAPSADNCTYRLANTPPSDTLDDTDTNDGQITLGLRSIGPISLANGTWYLRVTCGQRLGTVAFGTTRASTEFQIGAALSGTRSGPGVRLGPGVKVR